MEIEVDEEKLVEARKSEYEESTEAAVENEFGWLEQSGIFLKKVTKLPF